MRFILGLVWGYRLRGKGMGLNYSRLSSHNSHKIYHPE